MENKRKYERRLARAYLGVFDSVKNQLLGMLVDISIDGLQIVGETSCQAELNHELRIEMHEEICGSKALLCYAKCVWCKKRDDEELYITGFQFLSIGENTKKRIDLLMQSSAFRKYKVELNLAN
jgi:c-di-GMP-binding flagellar brake protein YcgR